MLSFTGHNAVMQVIHLAKTLNGSVTVQLILHQKNIVKNGVVVYELRFINFYIYFLDIERISASCFPGSSLVLLPNFETKTMK